MSIMTSLRGCALAAVAAFQTVAPAGAQEFGIAEGDSRIRVVILGSSAGRTSWRGSEGGGTSAALQVGDDVYVVDFGRNWLDGYFRAGLGSKGKKNTTRGLETMRAAFITHLHADHVVDLPRLVAFGSSDGLMTRDAPVPIYGPGASDYEPLKASSDYAANVVTPEKLTRTTTEMFDLLVSAFATDLNDNILDSGRPNIYTYLQPHDIVLPEGITPTVEDFAPEMDPFEVYKDENVTVTATLASHGPIHPAFAFRFETEAGSVVFAGDTAPHPNIVKISQGADILIHEADDGDMWRKRYANPTPAEAAKLKHLLGSHTDLREVGQVAAEAGAKKLVLNHYPASVTVEMVAERVTGFDGPVIRGEPGLEIVLRD